MLYLLQKKFQYDVTASFSLKTKTSFFTKEMKPSILASYFNNGGFFSFEKRMCHVMLDTCTSDLLRNINVERVKFTQGFRKCST